MGHDTAVGDRFRSQGWVQLVLSLGRVNLSKLLNLRALNSFMQAKHLHADGEGSG